jgi:hypothetical protein
VVESIRGLSLPEEEEKGEPKKKVETKADPESVLKHLKQTPANISAWHLLSSSREHRKALLDALVEIDVAADTNPAHFVNLVMGKAGNEVSFNDSDLPPEGKQQKKALYIEIECLGKKVSHVMVDGGSSINVCPLQVLSRLGLSTTQFHRACRIFYPSV